MRHLALVGIAIALLGLPGRGQAPGPRLPAAALDAADIGVLPLASVLATRGVPTGVVTREDPSAVAPRGVDPSAPATATLDDVIARLRARHPDYEAVVANGVLAINQRDTACASTIESLRLKANSIDSDAIRLPILLSWLASGAAPPVPAGTVSVLGGREGDPMPAQPSLPALHLVVAEGMTLRAAFDEVVRLNKGGVWIVWQHQRDDGSTGCRSVGYYSNGQVGASTKDFASVK